MTPRTGRRTLTATVGMSKIQHEKEENDMDLFECVDSGHRFAMAGKEAEDAKGLSCPACDSEVENIVDLVQDDEDNGDGE